MQLNKTMCSRAGAWARLLLLALLPARAPLAAQSGSPLDLGGTIEVGGEEARYLRVLQVAGLAPLTAWTIQPFSPQQVATLRHLAANPWKARFDSIARRPNGVVLLRPKERLIENSSYPFQVGGGPTWEGRGLTGEVQAGAAAAWGPFSLQVAPLAFLTQNAPFTLAPNGDTGSQRFADARFPGNIDAPQRFGTNSYGRLTPGTSAATIDAFHLMLSLTSAPEQWGPEIEYPLVLGPNAGGFPALYAGTDRPLNLWLFQLHGRVVYGKFGQSAYTSLVEGTNQRLGDGLVLAATPRGIPGLEVGAGRFLYQPWVGTVPAASTLERVFSGGFNLGGSSNEANLPFENGLASVFARWAVPAARAEFYGEFYKEDFTGRFHESPSLVEEPDDLASYAIGFQRVLSASDHSMRVLRAEIVNGESSHQEIDSRQFVTPIPPYIHTPVTQGATLDGMIVGSPQAYGGSGWRTTYEEYIPAGRRSLTFERFLRLDYLPTINPPGAGGPPVHPDVIYDLTADFLRFSGRMDYGLTVIPAVDLNRNLVAKHDVFNLTVAFTARGWRR